MRIGQGHKNSVCGEVVQMARRCRRTMEEMKNKQTSDLFFFMTTPVVAQVRIRTIPIKEMMVIGNDQSHSVPAKVLVKAWVLFFTIVVSMQLSSVIAGKRCNLPSKNSHWIHIKRHTKTHWIPLSSPEFSQNFPNVPEFAQIPQIPWNFREIRGGEEFRGPRNGAFGKPCPCPRDPRHFRHFRRFTGFEQQSPCGFTG